METINFECPHCHKIIDLDSFKSSEKNLHAFSQMVEQEKQKALQEQKNQIRQEVLEKFENEKKLILAETESKYQKEISNLQNDNSKLELQYKVELDEKINGIAKQYREEIEKLKISNETLQSTIELEKQNVVLEIQKNFETKIIDLESKNSTMSLQYEMKLKDIDSEITKKYQTQIEDLKVANAQNKILQSKRKGENFEHEVEADLRSAFGMTDIIEKQNITNESKKADYIQTIRDNDRNVLGKIVYEVKNAEWKDSWIAKLSTDVANNKTKYGILIATSFNDRYHGVPFVRSEEYPDLWITDSESFIFVAQIIRKLIEFESNYNKMKTRFLKENNDKALIDLEKKNEKILEFWTKDFPKTNRILKTELASLEAVVRSLSVQGDKITKAKRRIEDQLAKKIIDKLSVILGEFIDLEEAEETEE